MSILTPTLKKIVNWLQVNDPESIAELRSGLTDQEIKKITQNLPLLFHTTNLTEQEIEQSLPLILPWEVGEIYHYCNGEIALTPSLFLEPLEKAIENTCYGEWMRGNKISSSSHILPLFHGDGKNFYYVICDSANKSPVWCVYVGEAPRMYAASLTSLILSTWECYETGAYYMYFDEESGYSYVEDDDNSEKAEKIFQKYNPEQMDDWRYFNRD
ncbi:MAG: hypothetical protein JGK24_32310 [Microcoleus sp. PH2017_29_MFU_D_A]|uniref:hypothetical protein n=1 Tax=unclassified Microcoleus TaxID=2642155 RepID=UPI001D3C535E|nr:MULTISPECIES: hypothetical protein [unclassified Microcoleus]MCC3421723.1 hypothetical protein [Microcoleus sp. PH2017_07_MST_O_A]MCC3513329.1 hypothetical protein [Microcoleus sp. PH2017_17_BER_D_A]MCC3415947.1 hypothetical protein [Microcoleus sp. PH2017_02_FOX_O_A]MCC3519829.1 hypothetical protein [Microcoleus sp. PH2017_18_LLB_O_A]MCC3607785.1 hypothetical protein [Microcoleus sp. PH2017_29_MFU_D_A]